MVWFLNQKNILIPLQILGFVPICGELFLKTWQGLRRQLLAVGLHELLGDT